jgi:predicted transposase YbfD/YdcC
MLAAWCAEPGGLVRRKSHESTAIPALLPLRAMNGGLVTIDAMGCQTASAAQSRNQGGDDRLALPCHHQKAYPAVTQHWPQHSEPHLSWREAASCFDAFEDSHGRLGRSRVGTLTDLEPRPALAQGPARQAVSAVETMRTTHQDAPVTSDSRGSLAPLVRSAPVGVTRMRQHGESANQCPWSLDVPCNADRSRRRQEHAPANRAALRRVARHLVRQEPSRQMSLRQKRRVGSLAERSLWTVRSGAT